MLTTRLTSWYWYVMFLTSFILNPNLRFYFHISEIDQSDQSGLSKTVPIGKEVELECRSTLNPPVSYSWSKIQNQVPSGKSKFLGNGIQVSKCARLYSNTMGL